jgi:hypothetical protein
MPKTFNSFEELSRALDKMDETVLKGIKRGAFKIGEHAKNKLMRYPGRPSYPIKWASKKQRSWYFASRRAAGLDIRYTRKSDPWSQRLQQSWSVEKTTDGAIVGSRATYAPFVQSSELQEPMHEATGWRTDAQAVEEIDKSGLIMRTIQAEIHSILEGL